MVVALVIGELTNNSLKYGALRDGRSVSLTASLEEGIISLRWLERTNAAKGEKLAARDAGSGYAMMERMARAQRAVFRHGLSDGELQVELRVQQASQ
jgi:two-component sensor histidine kinase